MRRATAVILGTLTGTTLLVGAKVGHASADTSVADAGDTNTVVVGGPSDTNTSTKPSATPKATSGHSTKSSSSSPKPTTTSKTTQSATKTPTTKPTTASPTASGPKDGSYTAKADVKSGSYGTLTMTVTISSHKITKIAASESGGETNCYHSSCPKLTTEALSAQNANISTVSGATYTSAAYKSALSAILKTANA